MTNVFSRSRLELLFIGLVVVVSILGVAANSAIVGRWLGGTAAAMTDPLVLIGALLVGFLVRPSWLIFIVALLWAIIVGIIIVYYVRWWETIGIPQPSPVSIVQITASFTISAICSIVRNEFLSHSKGMKGTAS